MSPRGKKHQPSVLRVSGGPIVTMDADDPVAGEIVICGGRIVWTGRRGSAPESYGHARHIDLKGRLLLPAFADSHTHILEYARILEQANLHGIKTKAQALKILAAQRRNLRGEKSWLVGFGFDVNLWNGRWPTAADLDRIESKRPAIVSAHDGHAVWLNSVALKRCRIDEKTPDPEGGQIARDKRGHPTGILFETACEAAWEQIPRPTEREVERLLLCAQAEAHKAGAVAIGDMGSPRTLRGFAALRDAGKLDLRVWKAIPLAEMEKAIATGLRTGFGDQFLKIGGIKIFADGALGSRTAYMYKPYTSNPESRGISRMTDDDLDARVRHAARHGFSVCIHAIGDAAVGQVIGVLRKYESRFPKNHPPRIEHLQLIAPKDLDLLAGSRIVASMQPSHILTDRGYVDKHWGERGRYAFAFRSLWERGVVQAFGSDAPIEPLAPIAGIGAAVHRAQAKDRTWYPEEALTVWEAVWGFTAGAAIATGDGSWRGKIAPGYAADCVILDQNIFDMPSKDLFSAQVSATMIDGRIVYER